MLLHHLRSERQREAGLVGQVDLADLVSESTSGRQLTSQRPGPSGPASSPISIATTAPRRSPRDGDPCPGWPHLTRDALRNLLDAEAGLGLQPPGQHGLDDRQRHGMRARGERDRNRVQQAPPEPPAFSGTDTHGSPVWRRLSRRR